MSHPYDGGAGPLPNLIPKELPDLWEIAHEILELQLKTHHQMLLCPATAESQYPLLAELRTREEQTENLIHHYQEICNAAIAVARREYEEAWARMCEE